MLKAMDMRQGGTVKRRSFVLVAFATLSMAFAMSVPGYAFADDEMPAQQQQQGQNVVADDVPAGSSEAIVANANSDNQITDSNVADDESQSEDASTEETNDASEDTVEPEAPVTDASTINNETPSSEPEVSAETGASTVENEDSTSEPVVAPSDDASTVESDTPASEPQPSNDANAADASNQDIDEHVDETSTDSQLEDNTVADIPVIEPDDASYTPDIEDQPVVVNDDAESPTEQASTNLGNDPPEQASTTNAINSNTTNNSNIADANDIPQQSNASGIPVASTETIEPAASDEIVTQANYNYTLRFHTDQFVAAGGTTSVTSWGTPGDTGTAATSIYGSDHDFIYASDGAYITKVGNTFEVTINDTVGRPPVLLRHGYEIAYIYIKNPNANSYWRSTYSTAGMSVISALTTTAQNGKFNGATLDSYIQWGQGNQKTVNYFYNGTAKQNELNNQSSGMKLKTPDSLGAYTLNNEGWYLLQDLDYNDSTKVYTVKQGREAYEFTSSNDIWDLFSYYISTYYNGGLTGFREGEDRDVEKYYNTAIGTLTLYAGKKSTTSTPQFGVIYEKGSSDTGSTTSEQLINVSAASSTNTKTASELNFTKTGYSFKGWASSLANANAEVLYIAGGVPYSNIPGGVGTGNKVGDSAFHLFPIWHQDSYTVTYHAGSGSGTDNQVTYHSTGSSTTDKAAGQGSFSPYTKTNYTVTFAGWSRTSGGTSVQIAANGSLATVNNGSAPVDEGAYHLYAVWTETPDTFKVTYKATGSDSGSDSTVTYDVKDAGTTNFPSATAQGLSKTGYDFAGWSTTSGATTPDTGFTTTGTLSALSPTKNGTYTVYPVWTARNYTVNWIWRYNASGTALSGGSTTTTVTYGSSTPIANNIPSSAPTAGGSGTSATTVIDSNVQYTFKGWYLKRDNGAEWKSATSTTSLVSTYNLAQVLANADTQTTNSVTIWGIWDSANQVSITYIENKPTQSSEVTYSTVDKTYAGTTINIKTGHPEETGYTFLYWSTDKNDASTGTRYANPALTSPSASNTITPSGDTKLYAIWKVHSVKFALAPGTTETVVLNQKSSLPSTTKTVGQSISWTDLVTATPTRTGYDFVGFQGEYAATASTTGTFTINSSSPTSWTVLASAAATDGATITLTAQWTPTVYYVRYNPNRVSGDTSNTVKFWKGTTKVSENSTYAVDKQNGTGAELHYDTTNLDTFGGLSDPTYGDSDGNWWYTFVGWGSTSGATSPINSGDSFMTLYNAQTHVTPKYLELYAIWTPVTINIKYTTEDPNKGTVAPAAKSNISLAVATTGYGSTATPATPSGLSVSPYQLATPTWTYEGSVDTTGISFGIPSNTQLASYMPSLSVLRKLYLKGETDAEFQAHFEPRDFGYEIRIYTEQADGSYNESATGNGDNFLTYLRTSAPDGNTLTASYGNGDTKVNATTTVVPGTSITLADWALTKKYAGTSIDMSDLFEFYSGYGGKNEITISTVAGDNVIKLYYKRKTYDLTASYENKPSTVVDTASDHIVGKSTGIRWGESVTLTTPDASKYNGYDFAWGADVPAGATVTSSSFTLNETAFASLSGGNANVKGTFTPKSYTVEIRNNIPASQTTNNGYLGWTGGGTAKTTLVSSPTATASTSVTNGQDLTAWAPVFMDTTSLNFYFVGWNDGSETITDAQLRSITSWTDNKVYNGVWAEKVAIVYQPGAPDSQGNSKASWTTKTVRVTDSSGTLLSATTTASLVGGTETYSNALFNTIYASDAGAIVGNMPGAAAGWTFDYWEVANIPAYSTRKYGHTSAYDSDGYYLTGDSTATGIDIGSGGLTLVAHWKANPVSVTVNASGAVANNNSAYAVTDRVTISGNATSGRSYGAQTGTDGYNTDDEINLADYAPATTPAGYQLVGWTITDGGTTKTYATNAKVRLGTAAVELWPVFDENTVTFTYQLDTASAGRSSFTTETDTVYVVKHNGVTAHTVTPSDTHAYKFEGWKLDAEATTGFDVTTATIDSSASVFGSLDYTQNHTFYAHIAKQKYTVTFSKPGKYDDGSSAPSGNGASVKDGTAGAGYSNDVTVEWGDSIPSDCLDLVVPLGYKLAGWFEGDSTINKTYGTGDLAGIYQMAVTDDITLHPHFSIDTTAQFKVIYDYGEAAGVGTHQADKMVIWTANVLPDSTNDQYPTVPGYSFDNWYIDAAHTTTVDDAGSSFNNLWGYSGVDRDEEHKTITIHANFTTKLYTVNYELNGGDSAAIPSKSDVKWADAFGDSTNGFKPADPTRNGYTFGGWTVSWSDGTTTWDNGGAIVADADTYAKLSKNGTDAGTVTLVAKWNAAQLPVTYVFADGSTPNYTGNFEWDKDYNYLLAYANPAPSVKPTRTGYVFDGWTVTYDSSSGTKTGASINDTNPTSSIKTMVGDTSDWFNLTLTANWKQEVKWKFQDVLVDRDGTEHERDASLEQSGVVGQIVKHADSYTPHASNYYEGYDFDQYVAVLGTAHPDKTAEEVSLPAVEAGTTYLYKVYYIERAYDIVFYKVESDIASGGSAYGTTNANPWISANATLPGTDPTQTGKTFDGWYVKRTDGSEHKLDSTLAAALSTAPALGTQITAYAKWSDLVVTISWTADSNGSVANATTAGSSATRTATDTGNAVGTITATPNTNYDFEKWVYSTDGGTTWTEVTTASGVATLSGADSNGRYTELTPIPFKATGDTQAIWHDIAFKAQFVGSGSMNITIEHYKENANWKTGDPEADRWTKTETTGTSGDGDTFTATPQSFAGYTFDNTINTVTYGQTRESGVTLAGDDPTATESRIFRLYYTADSHTITYRYVLASDHSQDQTPPSGAPLLPVAGSAKTDQDYNVAAAPTYAGWDFSGWYESTNYGGTAFDGDSVTMDTADVVYVGTWKRQEKSVTFTNGGQGQVTMSPTSGYTVAVGDKVKTAIPSGNSETLQGLGVSWSAGGASITLAGWDVYVNGVKKNVSPIAISDPLEHVVTDVTEFRAHWSETFNVQYTRGAHGTFTDKNDTTVPKAEYVKVAEHTPWTSVSYDAKGTVDQTGDSSTNPNYGNPNAADGWTFVGWGSHDGSGNWTYYFTYDPDVDYGSATVTGYTEGTWPTDVTQNWEFIAFFKPQTRTLIFSNEKPISPHGDFTPAAVKTLSDGDYTMDVKTGAKPTLLGANSLARDGYTLVGWRTEAGGATYLPGSSDTFVMPELPLSGSVTLYPIFALDQVTIDYGVDPDCKTGTTWWGGVSNNADTIRNEGDTISGSIATANNGYVFDFWYKADDTSKTPISDATFDSATGKLTPTESGTYLAHFSQKTYTFHYVDAYGSEDVTTYPVTLPADPANAVWTDSVTIGAPTRAGFDFQGWDVYDASDWDATNKVYDGTASGAAGVGKLRNVRAAGTYQVSQITDVAGDQTNLVLVAVWTKETLHVIYDANGGDWSNDKDDYPTSETVVPSSTNVAADAALQYNTEAGDPITLRNDNTISLAGERLIGWKYVELASGSEVAGTEQYFYLTTADYDASTETAKHLVSDGFTMPTQSVKLIAIWADKTDYQVTFDVAGGDAASAPADRGGDSDPITWTTVIDLKNAGAVPTYAGKTFLGWTIQNSNGTALGGTDAPANYVNDATMAFNLLAQNDDDPANAHLTLMANWADKAYTVTFDVNGGEASTKPDDYTAADNLQWDGSVTLQQGGADPTYTGRTFTGWKVFDKNGNAIQDSGADLVVASGTASKLFSELALADTDDTVALTLVAQWADIDDYAVTFVDRPADDPVTADTVSHMPADVAATAHLKWGDSVDTWENGTDKPARDGYTFMGWDVYKVDPTTAGATAIGTVAAADATKAYSAMADADTTKALWLVAKWQERGDYNVVFLPGDDTGATKVDMDTMPDDQPNIPYTKTGISTEAPTRPGYTFKGWKSSVSGADVAATTTSVDYKTLAGNDASITTVTLTADWDPITDYQVTYSNGVTSGKPFTGTLPTPNPRAGLAYDATDIANPDLTGMRDGYDFVGWKVTSDANPGTVLTTITSYAVDSVYSALAGDASIKAITLTADWRVKSYGVTYHLSDGTWQTAHITDIPSGGNADSKVPVNADITYTVRAADTVSRTGYTLLGWQTAADGGTPYKFDGTYAFTMPAADVDLYPIWKPNDYAVTFEANEPLGTATSVPADVDPIAYDGTVTYGTPVLTGFDFKGWNVYKTTDWTASGTSATPLFSELAAGSNTYANLAGDPDVTGLTFVAQWDAKSFYVQYHSGSTATEPATWHADKIAADAMGALNNPDNPIFYQAGVVVTMRGQDTLTTNGKRLVGWKDGTDAGANEYYFATRVPFTFVMPTDNVNLYPIWVDVTDYTVTFADGIAALDPTKIASGAAVQNMPYASETVPYTKTGLSWTSDVNTQAPSLAGWKFKGWTVYDNGTPKAVVGDTLASPKVGVTYTFNNLALADLDERHDLTLVANWEIDARYAVTFLDGVLPGEITPVTNMPYATEAVPYTKTGLAFTDAVAHTAARRAGYVFDGWSVKAYGVSGAGIDLADVTAGTTAYYLLTGDAPGNPAYVRLELTAKWTAKTIYKVSFKSKPDSDTGTTAVIGLPGNLTGLKWESDVYAGSASAPTAPTRVGYTFDHWAIQDITDSENVRDIGRCGLGTFKYSALAADDAAEHVLLTAVWVANKWKVTYVDESGAGTWVTAYIPATDKAHPGVNAGTYDVDEAVTVRGANVMTRTGFTLVGWATTSANAAAGIADAVDFTMPDNDVSLYAVWEGKVYTVHFLENKPVAATDPLQVVQGMPYATEATPLTKTNLGWNDAVDTQHPTLAGYVFAGWVVEDAEDLGAKTGMLNGTVYTYDKLALDDTISELTLVAIWEPDTYRLIYVDPTDADGAAAATQVENLDDVLWTGTVSIVDPWTLAPAYAVKDAANWQFDGWTITLDDGSIVELSAADDLSYAALAARTGLKVTDVATATDTPALTLTATWTRRVPFVVDFVKVAVDGSRTVVTADAETLKGLDGDDIALVWASTVLDLGNGKSYKGYTYNRTDSIPNVVGTLATSQLTDGLIHVELLFDAVTDYVVTYDANGIQTSVTGVVTNASGAYLVADLTHATTTKTAASPAWDSLASGFTPVDAEWAKTGFRLDHWYYVAANGSRHDFDATMTFAEIAEAIYGTVDGTEGLSTLVGARPVTLLAAWVEKNDYKIVYDNNYATDYTTKPEGAGYIDGKFIPATTGTPASKNGVAWTTSDIEPTDADVIVEPGRDLVHNKDGNLASLYELDGWNYSTDDGTTQFAAEGKTFAEIAHEIYGDNEPAGAMIRLFARWREIDIELKYTPRNVKSDEYGNLVLEGGNIVLLDGAGNGTVSIGSETVSAVTGNRNTAAPKLVADGATATAAPGYHFVGWMRESDGKIIYVPGMDPAVLSTMSAASVSSLFAMADGDGMNVLPSSIANALTAFQAEQNTGDGYWHDETYLALFAANATALLRYDKNAEDATGEIPDVEAPEGSELTLSDGSGFTRKNWTLTGWNTEADGSGDAYALSADGWVMPEGGDILYAMWKKNPATLTYDPGSDDVTGVPEDQTDEWGTIVETAEGTPKRPHYTFKGWNTAKDGTGEWIAAGTELELLPEGITLYAQWELNSYDVTGGEPTEGGKLKPADPIKIDHGGYLPKGYLEAEPESGWHISGWKYVLVDEDGNTVTGTVSDPSELAITGTVTFTPVFEKDAVEKPVSKKASENKADSKKDSEEEPAQAGAFVGAGAEGTMPPTGDTLGLTVLLALAASALAIMLLAALMRRRQDIEEA